MDLPLTRSLYKAVTGTSCFYTTVQLLPLGSAVQAVEDRENNTLEIGVPKRVYLQIFAEGHAYFQGSYPRAPDTRRMPPGRLENTYFACLALLATTNDHSTVWRVHELVLAELCRLHHGSWGAADFRFCTALATSRLDRINKSSLLWHWLRKNAVLHVLAARGPAPLYAFIRQILRAMDAHLANCAAGFSLVWLVLVARASGPAFCEEHVARLLRDRCRRTLGDVLLWSAYGLLLQGRASPHAMLMYRQLSAQLTACGAMAAGPGPASTCGPGAADGALQSAAAGPPRAPFSPHREALRELRWLLDIQCTLRLPYEHMLRALPCAEDARALIRQKHAAAAAAAAARPLEQTARFLDVLTSLVN